MKDLRSSINDERFIAEHAELSGKMRIHPFPRDPQFPRFPRIPRNPIVIVASCNKGTT